jgi:hypothetical protein
MTSLQLNKLFFIWILVIIPKSVERVCLVLNNNIIALINARNSDKVIWKNQVRPDIHSQPSPTGRGQGIKEAVITLLTQNCPLY